VSLQALVELTEPFCASCDGDLLHCHGTVALHRSGRYECLDDDGCRVLPEVHEHRIDCDLIDCCC